MSKKITAKTLNDSIIGADHIMKKRGVDNTFIFRREFFYTGGRTGESFAKGISNQLKEKGFTHGVIGHGEVWKSFKGGASVVQNSHFWAEIKITGHSQ